MSSAGKSPTDLYLLYGPPGSGKTGLAHRLQEDHRFFYVSAGEITRREISSKSAEGLLLKHYLDNVVEYPTELISSVLRRGLSRVPSSWDRVLLDGFPKYRNEAGAFLEMVPELAITLAGILILECPLGEALQRASTRRLCRNCGYQSAAFCDEGCPHCNAELIRRDDDEPQALQRRYRDYAETVEDTVASFNASGTRIIRICATESPELVYNSVCQQLSL